MVRATPVRPHELKTTLNILPKKKKKRLQKTNSRVFKISAVKAQTVIQLFINRRFRFLSVGAVRGIRTRVNRRIHSIKRVLV